MAFKDLAEAEVAYTELQIQQKQDARDNQSNRKGYNGLKKFLEAKGFDVDNDLEEQWDSSGPGKSKTQLDDLNKKLDVLNRKYEKSEQEKAALQEQSTYSKIKGDLKEKMKDVIGGQDLIDLWVATKKIKVSDTGKTIFDDDGEEVSLDKAVEKFIKNNPDRIKVSQKNGAGSQGNKESGAHKNTETKEVKSEDFYNMSQKDREAYIKTGGKIIE